MSADKRLFNSYSVGVMLFTRRAPVALSALVLGCGIAVAAQTRPDLGPNVLIVDPSQPAAQVQAAIDRVYSVQQHNEFGPERNAILFLPGDYHLNVPVGFYTDVRGLGATPDAVQIMRARARPMP